MKKRTTASITAPMLPSARLPVAETFCGASSTDRLSSSSFAGSTPASRKRTCRTIEEMASFSAAWVKTFETLRAWYSTGVSPNTPGLIQTQASICLAITRRLRSACCAARSAAGGSARAWKLTISSRSRWPPNPCAGLPAGVSASCEFIFVTRAGPTLPVSSTTTMLWLALLFESNRVGTTEIADTNRGRISVVSQKALVLARWRNSRFAMTTTLLGRIAHRLEEDLFELRLLGAELVDVEESHHLPQRVGPLDLRLQQQLHDAVLDHRVRHLGHRLDALEVAVRHQAEGVAPHLALDRLQLAVEHRAAVGDQADVVAHPFGQLHPVSGEHDALALRPVVEQQVAEELLVERVEPGERLVEDQQVGRVQHGADELHLLLHALGQLFDLRLRPPGELHPVEPALDVRHQLGPLEAADLAEEDEHVHHRHLPVEAALLGQIADPPQVFGRPRVAEHLDLSGVGGRDVHDHADRGRLAGAVRPQQPEDAPRRHGHRNAVHRHEAPVGLADVPQFENGCHGWSFRVKAAPPRRGASLGAYTQERAGGLGVPSAHHASSVWSFCSTSWQVAEGSLHQSSAFR